MRKTLFLLLLIAFTVSSTALHSSQHEIQVQGEISGEDKNFYPEQRTVEFPSLKSAEDVKKSANASYQEYVSWQAKQKGLQKIISQIKLDFGLKGIRTGSNGNSVEVTYIQNESIKRNYTFENLKQIVPTSVRGSYEVNGKTVNTTVDVNLQRKEDSVMKDELNYAEAKKGRATESFGSSSGEKYNASFKLLNLTQGEHTGEQIRNVTMENNSISFTGYIELSKPCNKVEKSYEKTNSELVLKVDSYSTEKPCVDIIAFKKYSFNIKSDQPIRLEVRHDGTEVRTLETRRKYSDEAGIIDEIVNVFQNLFSNEEMD